MSGYIQTLIRDSLARHGVEATFVFSHHGLIIAEIPMDNMNDIIHKYKSCGIETKGRFYSQHADGSYLACRYGGRRTRHCLNKQEAIDFITDDSEEECW